MLSVMPERNTVTSNGTLTCSEGLFGLTRVSLNAPESLLCSSSNFLSLANISHRP